MVELDNIYLSASQGNAQPLDLVKFKVDMMDSAQPKFLAELLFPSFLAKLLFLVKLLFPVPKELPMDSQTAYGCFVGRFLCVDVCAAGFGSSRISSLP